MVINHFVMQKGNVEFDYRSMQKCNSFNVFIHGIGYRRFSVSFNTTFRKDKRDKPLIERDGLPMCSMRTSYKKPICAIFTRKYPPHEMCRSYI